VALDTGPREAASTQSLVADCKLRRNNVVDKTEIEKLGGRVTSLENKILLATGAALVLAAWLGVTTFFTIPNAVRDVMKDLAAKKASDDIERSSLKRGMTLVQLFD
jgi:hypothetical protein